MRPNLSIKVNGQEVAASFYARLISATFSDQEGREADTCQIELNDGPEVGFISIPERGDTLEATLDNGQGATFVGRYTLDTVTVKAFPFKLELSGKSADVRKDMKKSKERHWDEKTVKDIVEEIAGEHGLEPKVSGEVGDLQLPWVGQDDESDLQFLERLARRVNAVFAVKNGKLLFTERGSGQTASGSAVSAKVVTAGILLPDTFSVTMSDRSRYKEVIAKVTDHPKNERIEVREISDEDGEGEFALRETFGTEEEAEKAAKAKAKELKRAGDRLNFSTWLDPSWMAGIPVAVAAVRPQIDGTEWIAKTVRHQVSKVGVKTEVECEAKV